MKKILEVRGLSKIYGRGCPQCIVNTGPEANTNICADCDSVVATHDVSLDLHAGEILGIMGESGSGKSTVVKTLYFDATPTAGEAIFFDEQSEAQQWELFTLNAARQRWLPEERFWHYGGGARVIAAPVSLLQAFLASWCSGLGYRCSPARSWKLNRLPASGGSRSTAVRSNATAATRCPNSRRATA